MEKRNQKILILVFFLGINFALSGQLNSQNCYVQLFDGSGITPSQYQLDILEKAACRLRDSLPVAFQNSFKVYDFGFYLHNQTMVGGYPEMFQLAITQVESQSQYYLLFGKQTDKIGVYTKFWVALKLPNQGIFYCIDEFSPSFRGDLTTKYGIITNAIHDANEKFYFRYHEAEIAAMDSLRSYVTALKQCCIPPEPNQRRGPTCSSCVFLPNEFGAILSGLGMAKRSFTKIIDTNPSSSQGEQIGYSVEYSGGSVDLDVVMDSVKRAIHSQLPNVSIRIYPLNYIDDCFDYQDIIKRFQGDEIDVGILIGVVGENGKAGNVYWKTISRNFEAVPSSVIYVKRIEKEVVRYKPMGETGDEPPFEIEFTFPVYGFTLAASLLLSNLSDIIPNAYQEIRNVEIRNNQGGVLPAYDPNQGGGGMTFPWFKNRHQAVIQYTSNYFAKTGYGNDPDSWLYISAHEVIHIKHIRECNCSTLEYFRSFAWGYVTNLGHNTEPREIEADYGSNRYIRFNQWLVNFKKTSISKIFTNGMGDFERSIKLGELWGEYPNK